jgi:hypothetical protein
MGFYIEVDNEGNCINHPIDEDNLIQVFGSISSKYEPFVRVEQNVFPDLFEVMNEVQYLKVDGVWTDVWTKRDMNSNEKFKKNAQIAREFHFTVTNAKTAAEQSRDNATDDEQKALWQDYIDELQRWVYRDHTGSNLPKPPRFDSEGNIMSLQAEGSPPDVD